MAGRVAYSSPWAAALLLAVLLCAWTARAGESGPPASNATNSTADKSSVPLTFRLSESTTGRAGVTGNQAWYGDLETDLAARWEDWRAGYERRDFFWNNTSRLQFADGGGEPWDVLHRYFLARDLFDGEYERFDYYAGVILDTAFETQPDDATGLGGYGHAAIDLYEGFKLGVEGGVSMVRVRGGEMFTRSDLRAHLELPETRIRRWLLRQIGLPDEKGRLALGVEYLNRRRLYRLADNSQVKGRGYVDMGEASVGLAATLRLAEGIEMRVIPRYYLPRTLNFYNRDGENVGRIGTGHSWGGALEFEWSLGQ